MNAFCVFKMKTPKSHYASLQQTAVSISCVSYKGSILRAPPLANRPETRREQHVQRPGMHRSKMAVKIHGVGCREGRNSCDMSRIAPQKAPTRAFASTSAQTVVWARIFEKKMGSLQLVRSHSSSSNRI